MTERHEVWKFYPKGWPACMCGLPVMDGHLTCGRLECGTQLEAEQRITEQRLIAEMQTLAEPFTLALRPDTLLSVVGLLQLAHRHHGLSADHRALIVAIVNAAREYFKDCPAMLEVIRQGADPQYDR